MGGRLLDFVAQGLEADLPVPVDMPARIVAGAAAIYYAYDATKLYVFNEDTVAWDSVLLGGGIDPETVQDIVGLFLLNGVGIAITYDDALNQLLISSSITQYTDEMAADAIGALLAAGADVGLTVVYDDSGNAIAITIAEASTSDVWTGTSSAVVVTPKKLFDASAPVAVAYGAAITLDGNTGFNFSTTLTGPVTFSNPTNMKPGQSGLYVVTQDATGGRVASWGSNWRFEGGAASGGVLSTGPNVIDAISYFVRADGSVIASLMKDVKA